MAEQKHKTGSVSLKTSQRGRKSLISKEQKAGIQTCIEEKPDITINERREKLGLTASHPTVARIVHNMGYTEKEPSRIRTGALPMCRHNVPRGVQRAWV